MSSSLYMYASGDALNVSFSQGDASFDQWSSDDGDVSFNLGSSLYATETSADLDALDDAFSARTADSDDDAVAEAEQFAQPGHYCIGKTGRLELLESWKQ